MIKNTAIALAMRVGGTASWLILTAILARLLSVEEFGFVFYAINLSMVLGTVAVVGFDQTVLRFGSAMWENTDLQGLKALLTTARITSLASGLILTLILMAMTIAGVDTPITGTINVAFLVGLAGLATAIMSVHRDALRSADHMIAGLFGNTLLRGLVPMPIIIGLALAKLLTPTTAIIAYLIGLGASLLYEFWQIGKLNLPSGRINQGDSIARRRQFVVALGIWPGEVSAIVLLRATGLVIGLEHGLMAAGAFFAAERIAQLGKFFIDAVRMVIGPMIARSTTENRQDAVARASYLMLLTGFIGALCLLCVGWLFLLFLGQVYLDAFPILILLLFAQLSWTILGPTGLIMNMTGLEKARSLINLIGGFVLIPLLFSAKTTASATLIFVATIWTVNGILWLIIYTRSGIRSGVFGLSWVQIKQYSREESNILRSILMRLYRR